MFGATFNLVTRVGLTYFFEYWKMVVLKPIVYSIISATETSSKMVSTLCQNWFKKKLCFFCGKAQNFVWFGQYNFVQISPACGPNT